MDPATLPTQIRAARQRAGLTIDDLAARLADDDRAYLDAAWLTAVEAGEERTGMYQVAVLAEAIGTDTAVLYGDAEHDPLTAEHRRKLEQAVAAGRGADPEVTRRALGTIERLERIADLKHDAMQAAHRREDQVEQAIMRLPADARRQVVEQLAEPLGRTTDWFDDPLDKL